MGTLIIILDFYFMFFEFYGFLRETKNYVTDIENYIDGFGAILNIILVKTTFFDNTLDTGDR